MTMTVPTLDDVEYAEGDIYIPPGLPQAEWEKLGAQLRFKERNARKWLGLWWLYGEHAYGEAASQAAPTGYEAKTLQNAAWVVERIGSRWRENVPFDHHADVAALPPEEQVRLLDEAARTEMPREQLRAKVRHLRAVKDEPDRQSWQAVCRPCGEFGPHFDGKPGDCHSLYNWLDGHVGGGHEVALVADGQPLAAHTEAV